MDKKTKIVAKPFIKWAGGKSQLLTQLDDALPTNIKETKTIERYIEPFVGGGAFFFFLKSKYNVKKAYLLDINPDLILCYQVIKSNRNKLIQELRKLSVDFKKLSPSERKEFYYTIRKEFNKTKIFVHTSKISSTLIRRAAQVIFLNKTCYNGLFRQNKKGEFNVPYGNYKNPKICDKENLVNVSELLKNTAIINDDFSSIDRYCKDDTLVYFDPPYLPISKTSNFTNYSKDNFTYSDHRRLAKKFNELSNKSLFLLLSNSNPKNYNAEHSLEKLYKKFTITFAEAKRNINCIGERRGKIPEAIITNYKRTIK